MDDEPIHTIKDTASLMAAYILPTPQKGRKPSERGELLAYFAKKLGVTIPRVASQLKGMQDLRTLYYIKSDCDQAEARGIPWGAAFHTSLKVPE